MTFLLETIFFYLKNLKLNILNYFFLNKFSPLDFKILEILTILTSIKMVTEIRNTIPIIVNTNATTGSIIHLIITDVSFVRTKDFFRI